MTEDQKAMSLVLELLHAAKGVPVSATRLSNDAKYCGYRNDLAGVLDLMEERGLIARFADGLGVRRYLMTDAGKEAFDGL
jgi:hypothetical protein